MERIFISYKRVDKAKVFRIKDQIESALGEKCWIDLDGIESDAQFMNVIINAINNSEVVLFMYSKAHSKISDYENDWTIRELNYAKIKKKKIVFINTDNSILSDIFLFDYSIKQQIDATKTENINKLIKDIAFWLNIEYKSTKQRDETPLDSIFNSKICKRYLFGILILIVTICALIIMTKGNNTNLSSTLSPNWSYKCSNKQKETISEIISNMVKVNDNLYCCKYEVTVAEWENIMEERPQSHGLGRYPVQSVSERMCSDFLEKISDLSGINFNIPTTEEWVIIAKGDEPSSTMKFPGSDSLENVAWYASNSNYMTHPVGTKCPNKLGIYDLGGNVWELCYDKDLGFCSTRGGSFQSDQHFCKVTDSSGDSIYIDPIEVGLRLVINNRERFKYQK